MQTSDLEVTSISNAVDRSEDDKVLEQLPDDTAVHLLSNGPEQTDDSNITSLASQTSTQCISKRNADFKERKPGDPGCVVLDVSSWSFIPWNNPDNLLSQDTVRSVGTVVGAIFVPILFLIAVPCNILNMLVFSKQGLKERVNLCLFYLSLVDVFHVIIRFVSNLDRLQPPFTQTIGPVFEFIIEHKLFGFHAFISLSGFTSTLIACERCLCVVSPLRSQTLLKTRTTAAVLAVATVVIMSGSMVIGMRWSVMCVFDPLTSSTSKAVRSSQFHRDNKKYLDGVTFILGSLQIFTYVIVISATTLVTSVKLRKMAAWREQSSSSTLSSREMALTRTLIAVSVLYLFCSIPAMIAGIGFLFVPDYSLSGRYYNFTQLFVSLIELASVINATFNFFVYCSLGTRSRSLESECLKIDVSRHVIMRHV
ncbi:uncharacterized protein LOC143297508 [Babylonia areolata]|uniref:uncharacterized protein LOC143297508 n=1 Tax=Babylonia areolata TaxID=304850 RepID=UPI003FD36E4D